MQRRRRTLSAPLSKQPWRVRAAHRRQHDSIIAAAALSGWRSNEKRFSPRAAALR